MARRGWTTTTPKGKTVMHIKDDFGSGGPISKVSAAWFNGVAKFINGFIPGPGISFDKKNDGSATVIQLDTDIGTPGASGSFPTDEVTQTAATLWEAGGANGATVLMAYKGEYAGSPDYEHRLYVAKLTISKSGLITKIEAVENSGIAIGA